jgi:AraC-like DNA-binding protein
VHFDYVFLGEGFEFSPYSVYLGRKEGAEAGGESRLGERPAVEPAEMTIPEKMTPEDVPSFYDVFRELRMRFEEARSDSRLWLKSAMLRLLALIQRELVTKEGVRIGHAHADLVLDAIAYMEEHYAERIGTAFLAKRAALTPKYFGTIFRQATGRSASEYLLRLRMEEAKRLLGQRKFTVQEVAERVGIGDLYYFSKLFKRMEGIPPKKYADSVSWPDGL